MEKLIYFSSDWKPIKYEEDTNLLYILKLADMMEADELSDLMPEYKDAAKQAVEQIKAVIDNCEIYWVPSFLQIYS